MSSQNSLNNAGMSNNSTRVGESEPELTQETKGKLSNLNFELGRIPNILLYVSFAVLSVFYALTVAAPVLFACGIILATAFGLRAFAEVWKVFTKGKSDKLNWLRPNFLESLSSGIIGAGLLTLGILMLINPAFLGAFLGVSFAVKIGLVAAGVTFLAKGVFNYFSRKIDSQNSPKLKPFLDNLLDVVLYGAGLGLGIMALILNGAFAIAPVLFATVFLMRTAASVFRIFNKDSERTMPAKIARGLEVASLFLVGGLLLVSAIAFAPTIAAFLGLPALFCQIAGCIAGGLFAFAALAKMLVGSKIELFDTLIATGNSKREEAIDKIKSVNNPMTQELNSESTRTSIV